MDQEGLVQDYTGGGEDSPAHCHDQHCGREGISEPIHERDGAFMARGAKNAFFVRVNEAQNDLMDGRWWATRSILDK